MNLNIKTFRYLILIICTFIFFLGFEKDIIYADDPGGRIAYVSNSSSAGGGLEEIDDEKTSYDIWVMDLGSFDLGGKSSQSKFYKVVFPGSDQSDEIHPALSPKGDWVAFSSNRDDDWNIYVFHLESEQLYQITFCCEDEHEPTWLFNESLAYVSINQAIALDNGLIAGMGEINFRNIWDVIDGKEDVGEKNIAQGFNFSPKFSKYDARLIYVGETISPSSSSSYSDLFMFHDIDKPEGEADPGIYSGHGEVSIMNPAWTVYGSRTQVNSSEFFVDNLCFRERKNKLDSDVIFFNKLMNSSVTEFMVGAVQPDINISWRCEDPRNISGELPYSNNMIVNDVSPDGDWLLITFVGEPSPGIKGNLGEMGFYSLREFDSKGKPRVMCCIAGNYAMGKASWSFPSGNLPVQDFQKDIEINLFGNEVGVELELDAKSFFGGGVLEKEYERIDKELAIEIERIESEISFLEFNIIDQREKINREREDLYNRIQMDEKNLEIDFQRQLSNWNAELQGKERQKDNDVMRIEQNNNNVLQEIYNVINRRKQELSFEKEDLIRQHVNESEDITYDWNQQLVFLQEDIENRLNQLEIEKIEYIKYLNDYYDSEISNLNAEYLPRIENAECANPINGCSGSFIPPDERSTLKQFSVQDGSTVKPDTNSWRGIHGVMTIGESDNFDLGSGPLYWSIAGGQEGYFYAGDYTYPQVEIANVLGYRENKCRGFFDFGFVYEGYEGLNDIRDLNNAAALSYSIPKETVRFGTDKSDCNMGLLVFRQGEQYGVIDFKRIGNTFELEIEYWLGDPGVTDFSNVGSSLGKQGATITVPNIVSKTQFNNNYLGYEFSFTSEWNLEEWVDQNLNTYYSGNISTDFGSAMNISIKAIPRDGYTLDEHIRDELLADRDDFIENSREFLNSIEGVLLSGISPQWSTPHMREKIIFVTDNYRVVIMFMADKGIIVDDWRDLVDSLRKISSTTGISDSQKQEIDMLKNELENRKIVLEQDRTNALRNYDLDWEANFNTQQANWESEKNQLQLNLSSELQDLKQYQEKSLLDFDNFMITEIQNIESQIETTKNNQIIEIKMMISFWDQDIEKFREIIKFNTADYENHLENWKQKVSLDVERKEMDWKYNEEQMVIDTNMRIEDLKSQIIFLESQAEIEKERLNMEQSDLEEQIVNEEQNIQSLKLNTENQYRENIEELEREHQRMLEELNAEQEKLILEGKIDEEEATLRRMKMEQLMKRELDEAEQDYNRQQRDIKFKESQLYRLQAQAERDDLYGEGERGFLFNPKAGTLKGAGWEERLRDPGFLAMAGIIVTVGTSLFQMARGR